jgi:hypothetical protein
VQKRHTESASISVKPIVVISTAVIVAVIVGFLFMRQPSVSDGAPPIAVPQTKPTKTMAGPATPVTPASTTVGIPPSVTPDANANVASVVESARTGKFPERRSPLIAPPPFDPAAFAANPQAYLDIVEPGRVFQSAEPGPTIPVLSVIGTASQQIIVGGSCTLTVKTAPAAPVSFMTMDLGTFPNSLTAITVQADDQGLAKTTYTASGGVIADVHILAGSPGASGQVQLYVFVTDPPIAAK